MRIKNPWLLGAKGFITFWFVDSPPFAPRRFNRARAGVLTFTVGGTALEFHQLAFQLSSWLPKNTLNS
jgi:hypothetical protein